MTGVYVGATQIANAALGGSALSAIYKGSTKLWPTGAPGVVTRIRQGFSYNTSGGFDRSTSIPDIGAIPAHALIVVKISESASITAITDTAGNTYVQAIDASRTDGYRFSSSIWYCLDAKASATNAFDLTIEDGGGGTDGYLATVEVYTGDGAWSYLSAQSNIVEQAFATGPVSTGAITTTAANGVVAMVCGNGSDSGTVGVDAVATCAPGSVVLAHGTQTTDTGYSAMSAEYIFDTALSGQTITTGKTSSTALSSTPEPRPCANSRFC